MVATDRDYCLADADAAVLFDVDPKTILRWRLRGLPDPSGRTVKLAYVKVGGVVRTSRAALLEFVRAVNAPATGEPWASKSRVSATGPVGELASDQSYDSDGVI